MQNLWFQRRQFGGWGDALGVWGGNPIILDCDDRCTTINVINSLSNKKFFKVQQTRDNIKENKIPRNQPYLKRQKKTYTLKSLKC